jgi:Family of unknown function (DUF5716)
MELLSEEFSKSVGPRFFQPLTGSGRDLSIDLLSKLADSFNRGRRSIPRSEAVDVLKDALVDHPAFLASLPPEESTTEWSDPSYRANYHLTQFIEAGWLLEDEFRHNMRKRTVVLDSNAQALLALLREISGASLHTSSRFTDTFRSVIDAILSSTNQAFRAADEKPYATLRDMLDRCAKGMLVLRRIENLLRRFTREQAETLSRRRNLELVVLELQGLTRTQYFRELNNPLLFQRSDAAASRLEEITYEGPLLQRMASECVAREEAVDLAKAQLRVIDLIHELADTLRGLRAEAQQIERWASRFLAASVAKFRHLQSVPSRQLEIARRRLSDIADQIASRKWWQVLPAEQLPSPRLPELGFLWGTSSLWRPPRSAVNQTPIPVRRPQRVMDEEALRKLREVRRKAITQRRACAFVERILKNPGDRIESTQLVIYDHDTLIDVLSCLCYANGSRTNFRIHAIDRTKGEGRYAPAGDWYMERFILERTH